MSGRHIALLLLACAIGLAPFVLQQVGGDIIVHLTRLDCFGLQFWQGDLLPRWCFEADGGVGSPAPLFYPPLPYYITSIFYPLHWLGVTVYGVYVIAVAMSLLLAAFGAYYWLRESAGATAALIGAVFYITLPYHSEVLTIRSGYGELWVMAFAPLMASSLRRILKGQGRIWPFALWTALALLCEPAVVLCLLIGLGIYALSFGVAVWRQWLRAALGCVLALAFSAFYWLPVMHYLPFSSIAEIHITPVWANNFVRPAIDFKEGRIDFLYAQAITAAGFFCLCFVLSRRGLKGEALGWALAGIASLLLLFPISAPVWWLINAIAPIGFPWRMQATLLLALSFLMAAYVHGTKRKTVRGDALALVIFLFCFEAATMRAVGPEHMAGVRRMLASSAMASAEYRTPWTSPENATMDAAMQRYDSSEQSPVEITGGAGAVRLKAWSWRGIAMDVDALHGRVTLRVYQRYFPLWRLKAEKSVQLEPEQGTGYMLLTVPRGHHALRLQLESHWDTLTGAGARREKDRERQRAAPGDFVAN